MIISLTVCKSLKKERKKEKYIEIKTKDVQSRIDRDRKRKRRGNKAGKKKRERERERGGGGNKSGIQYSYGLFFQSNQFRLVFVCERRGGDGGWMLGAVGGGGWDSKKKETNAKFCSNDVRDAGKLGLGRAKKLCRRNEKEVNQIS